MLLVQVGTGWYRLVQVGTAWYRLLKGALKGGKIHPCLIKGSGERQLPSVLEGAPVGSGRSAPTVAGTRPTTSLRGY